MDPPGSSPLARQFVPAEMLDIIDRLQAWAHEWHLIELATQACRADLQRCIDERGDGWQHFARHAPSALTLKFFRHRLTFIQHSGTPPVVVTELMIFTGPGAPEAVGRYDFTVRLDGAVVGGFLIAFTPAS